MRVPYVSAVLAAVAAAMWSPAQAADLPDVAAPPPVFAPVIDWTGFYVGGFVGAARSDGQAELEEVQGPLLTLDVTNGLFPRSIDDETLSFYGGAVVGYDYQIGRAVIGARATLGYLDLEADPSLSRIDPNPFPLFNGVTTNSSYETELDYLGTLEATAGFAFGRTKIGVSGGLAVAEVENSVIVSVPNNRPPIFPYLPEPFSNSDRLYGYVAGVGIAHQVTEKLTISLDVMHFDLSDQSARAIDPPVFGSQFLDYQFENDGQIGRLAIAYRF